MCAYKYICRTHTHPLACKKMASNFAVALNHSNFLGVQSPTLSVFAITKPRAYSTSPPQHSLTPANSCSPSLCANNTSARLLAPLNWLYHHEMRAYSLTYISMYVCIYSITSYVHVCSHLLCLLFIFFFCIVVVAYAHCSLLCYRLYQKTYKCCTSAACCMEMLKPQVLVARKHLHIIQGAYRGKEFPRGIAVEIYFDKLVSHDLLPKRK